MSAFLGPIHYWLYNKILVGENMQKDILSFAENKGINTASLTIRVYEKYGKPDFSYLEDVIDEGNIHGWLQERINSLEYRLASIVTELLNKGEIKINELESIFRENGRKIYETSENKVDTASELFKVIFDNLVEGMPCDRVNDVEKDSDDEVIWLTTTCVHKKFWDDINGDVNNYYRLKDAWIEGFVNASKGNFIYERKENKSYIKKA